ncbi:glycosyltransferase family 4 protein [Pseudomonas hefeiensis]|uniref:glycosyltransferase family 4 protein n=1 Tax=Pseudomonas hefeiensis TaxID=2738125 RepID=UPI0027328F44|nr:glycosyltransferase family 4 protein [Pseudomonas sp. FP821]WLI38563.1 glycosyltransferase family 4 protein [Pseudomonas sp. FP821]
MLKVAHVTSVHSRYDIRIFRKECRTLAANGYDVFLVVADGKGDEISDGVKIIDAGLLRGRLNRIFRTTRNVLRRSKELNADIYHLHDPELLPIGLKLKKQGKVVIFDSHEDVPKQLLSKPYLSPTIRRLVSVAFSFFERFACPKLDGILTATPFIRDKFFAINPNTLDINNFPMIGELDADVPWDQKKNEICYVGGITSIRGIREVVTALKYVKGDVRLNLVGGFSEPGLEAESKQLEGWSFVNQCGQLGRAEVREVLGRSIAGLVTFHPLPNHVDAQPNKMFEYMSSGIPVIASNFPLWREIIEGNDCGICVDPLDSKAIAECIDYLLGNPDRAKQMGLNGQKAVFAHYNWDVEGRKLLNYYSDLKKSKGLV